MKKLLALLFLFSVSAQSAEIPLNTFEQTKLETLLRKIPSAFVKKEKLTGFIRKHYLFPAQGASEFSVKCTADYFGAALVPSHKVCEASVKSGEVVNDEYLIQLTDPKIVRALYKAISYGETEKHFSSHERIYGKGHDGIWRNLFRFSFSCRKDACSVTFSPKKSQT